MSGASQKWWCSRYFLLLAWNRFVVTSLDGQWIGLWNLYRSPPYVFSTAVHTNCHLDRGRLFLELSYEFSVKMSAKKQKMVKHLVHTTPVLTRYIVVYSTRGSFVWPIKIVTSHRQFPPLNASRRLKKTCSSSSIYEYHRHAIYTRVTSIQSLSRWSSDASPRYLLLSSCLLYTSPSPRD